MGHATDCPSGNETRRPPEAGSSHNVTGCRSAVRPSYRKPFQTTRAPLPSFMPSGADTDVDVETVGQPFARAGCLLRALLDAGPFHRAHEHELVAPECLRARDDPGRRQPEGDHRE